MGSDSPIFFYLWALKFKKHKMKNILIILMTFLGISLVQAQDTTQITLDNIYQDYLFYPHSVRGIRSMQDGEHYCKLSKEGVEEYSYKSGKKTRIIIDNNSLYTNDSTK